MSLLVLLSSALGFLAPFLPDVIKLFTRSHDNKHELAVMELRLKAGAQEHLWRMEEINAKADIEEARATHSPQQSFGVQLLDRAQQSGWPMWALMPAFYLFILLDFIVGFVRPSITYLVVGAYIAYRYACIKMAQEVITGNRFLEALVTTWTDNDTALLATVISYWFGDRTRQKVKNGK